MQSKYVFPDQIELTTPVEVTLHNETGDEIVVSGFVSARYFERPDIYDVTLTNERTSLGEIRVLHKVQVGRLKIVGAAVPGRISLAAYQSMAMSA